MYGVGVGTGATGTAMLAGMTYGSWGLMLAAGVGMAVTAVTIVRNTRRRKANQRP